ncbi:hypothetical protein BDD26_2288 [Xenorhabdus cabanillasii]|uniref:HicA-like toxin of HicAB toxin-antitoxin system n=1 Tax=Xenorhabdus cabanillasii TaxID=351673 RepID=A0A3D9UDD6_9GAMM|nr:hypothetical protein BDD26_2288 [Xenorhabdus cabanillasii]
MGSGLYPQLKEILLAHGCYFVRQGKGSHEILLWSNDFGHLLRGDILTSTIK